MANSVARRRLGAELRRLREAAGLTQADVGAVLGRTHTTILNWERGKTQIAKSDLVVLLAELRAPSEVRQSLEQLREESRQRGSREWSTYGLPSWLRSLASFEEDAAGISRFEVTVVPGLLQTEDYARAVLSALPQVLATPSIDHAVQSRLARQGRLTGDGRARFHGVIAETALRVEVGSAEVMAAQLQRLMAASEAENITIQVLPSTAGAFSAAVTGFGVLDFADQAADPSIAFWDGPLGGYLIHDESEVAALATVFTDLARAALTPDDSLSQVAAILSELTRKGTGHA